MAKPLDLSIIIPVAPGADPGPAMRAVAKDLPRGVTAEIITVSGTRRREPTTSSASSPARAGPAQDRARGAGGRGSTFIWRNCPVSSPNGTTGGRAAAGGWGRATGAGRGAGRGAEIGTGGASGTATGAGAAARGAAAGAGGGAGTGRGAGAGRAGGGIACTVCRVCAAWMSSSSTAIGLNPSS